MTSKIVNLLLTGALAAAFATGVQAQTAYAVPNYTPQQCDSLKGLTNQICGSGNSLPAKTQQFCSNSPGNVQAPLSRQEIDVPIAQGLYASIQAVIQGWSNDFGSNNRAACNQIDSQIAGFNKAVTDAKQLYAAKKTGGNPPSQPVTPVSAAAWMPDASLPAQFLINENGKCLLPNPDSSVKVGECAPTAAVWTYSETSLNNPRFPNNAPTVIGRIAGKGTTLCLATTFVDQGQGVIRRAANGPVVSLKTCSTPALEPSSTNSLALLKAYIEAKEQNIRYRLAAANGTDRCLVIDTGSGASLSVNAAGSLASANNCTGPFDPAKKMAPVMAGAKWVMSTEPPAQKAASASPPVSPATTPATPAISPAGQPPSGRQPAQAGTYNVTMNDITPRFWQFGRADGSLIAPRVQLMADGKIIGHANSNETSWGLENGAVVLYNAAKKPTTKFISMSNAAGKVTLSGPFIPAPQHVHVLTALTPSTARMEDITKRLWKFGRGDGSVIAPSVRLMPDGKIVGYAHPNEASWKLDNGAVVLLNQAGQPTSRFDSMIINGAAVTLSGPFLAQPQVTVVLTEVGMAP